MRPLRDGIYMSLYEAPSSNEIGQILARAANQLAVTRMEVIDVEIFQNSKKGELASAGFFGSKPIIKFSLRAEYVND